MKISGDIEKLLPFGYLFLILMGMLKDSIYYYQLGINILKFSTITDILMSPIAYLTTNPIVLFAVISLFISHYYLPKFLLKNNQKPYVQKMFELKSVEGFSLEEKTSYYNNIALRTLAAVLLSFYLGTGIADGYFTSERIEKQSLDYNYKINFNDDEPQEVSLLGTSSLYYFYVAIGQKHLKIAPISSVKNIELMYKTANR
ncbi:hypothetical protein K6T82_09680 [Flavobacterium sp. 17A]|uniref:Uncharacterized protein n=1 Tax=Flavobacterium potami TaxID=2872310 RepID=A0A9X1H9N7_9FLAO|nr:hypothetical protein [Flavobacterium potami]MBZ4035036.1 hypothetical protein [Flavobacterium potami]